MALRARVNDTHTDGTYGQAQLQPPEQLHAHGATALSGPGACPGWGVTYPKQEVRGSAESKSLSGGSSVPYPKLGEGRDRVQASPIQIRRKKGDDRVRSVSYIPVIG